MDSEKWEARIAGKKYTVFSAESAHQIDRAVSLLNRRLNEIFASSSRIDKETAAIAAALSLADELIQSQDDNTRLRRELTKTNEHENSH